MPLYQYQHEGTGRLLELIQPVAQRDQCPKGYFRIRVPQRVGVIQGILDPQTPDAAIPRALKDLEQTVNHRDIARQSGFTTRQLREIWAI